MHEAGKGDKRRPEDGEAYRNSHDKIFTNRRTLDSRLQEELKKVNVIQRLEKERIGCVDDVVKIQLDKDDKV